MTWRKVNMAGVIFCALLWPLATLTGWISSVTFLGHISMLALVGAFLSAWRSDVPIPDDK